MRRQSFERYYLEKIAVGEGCGCAEQALGMRDMDVRARELARRKAGLEHSNHLWAWLRRLFRWEKLKRFGPGP